MSDQFRLEGGGNHVEVEYEQPVLETLGQLAAAAEAADVPRNTAYPPEVEFLVGLVRSLRRELPETMRDAGWPAAMQSGDGLDDFITMTLKDVAVDARGRGTRASLRQALAQPGSE